jgi:RNA polymerase sigma-B factor
MPDLHPPYSPRDRTEDLDAAAGVYARDWIRAPAARRNRLRDDFIRSCLPFAGRMARQFGGRPEPVEDLVQVARLGLVKSVDRYDPGRGSFTAFARATIRGEIKRHFRDRTWAVHVNRRLQDLSLEVAHTTAELTHALGREPSTSEIAGDLRVSEADVRQAVMCAAGHTPISLSMPLDDDGDRRLVDVVGEVDESIEVLADRLAVDDLLREMPRRIQRIIALHFYGGRTQSEIAAEFGISQMHVSRLLRQALTWLRAALLSDVQPRWPGVEEHSGPESLRVHTRQADGRVSVDVAGEVDRDNKDRLRRRLNSAIQLAAPGPLTIDLTRVPLIDVAGARVLGDACRSAVVSRIEVTLTGVQPQVAAVLAPISLPPAVRW